MSLKRLFRALLGVQIVLGLGLSVLTGALFLNQKELSQSQRVHYQSYLLADELRQSSDDLTRLARTYVATGDEEFERQYWTVLDIRNGKLPRPLDYNRIYWDFVSGTNQKPRPDGAAVSLHELMRKEGIAPEELQKLALAQKNSDELVNIERVAMNAVKGRFADGEGGFTVKKEPDRAWAIKLMNDAVYHQRKYDIMKPIDEFYGMLVERTVGDVARHERQSILLLRYLGGLIALILGMFGYSFVVIQQQITQRELAEAASKKMVKAKSQFISMVSHELRSPLSAIKQALEIVLGEMVGSLKAEQKDILALAVRNVDRLKRLINNALDFQRIEAGKMTYDISEHDMHEVVAEVQKSMSVLSRQKGLELRIELEKDLPKIKFDQDRLIQVLTNLVSNAINNTETGSVTLAVQKEANAAHFTVRDTGWGIPAEEIPKLFQPFEQVSGPTSKCKGGSGLGLVIAREIVHGHSGAIWVESEEGQGSVFHFTLPLS